MCSATHHGGDNELPAGKLLGEPIDLAAGVAEDNGLSDGDRLVQVAKGIQLPFLFLYCDVELLDTFESQLVTLDEDTDGITHELLGNLQHVRRHGSGKEDDLSLLREKLEDVVDLLSESTGEHFISLVETEDLHVVGLEGSSVDHVVNATRGTDNDVRTLLKLLDIFTDVGTTDTRMALNVQIVSEGDDDLLDLLSQLASGCEDECLGAFDARIELLEDRNGESGSLAGSGLGLGNNIVALDDRDDGALLDSRGTLEAGDRQLQVRQ